MSDQQQNKPVFIVEKLQLTHSQCRSWQGQPTRKCHTGNYICQCW